MMLGPIFDRFVESSPACVMYRAVMENVFAPASLNAVFRKAAVKQYERELLFSTLVDLVGMVVCRIEPSVHAAYVRKRDQVQVSIRALYDKLSHVEVGTSRALVQYSAARVGELIDRTKGRRKPLLPGYRVRLLDGNHLGGTDHRLKVLRRTAAGALPGQTLALLDPERMVIEDVFPCEDGHAQERSLLNQVLPVLKKKDLLIDDRNFCTLMFLCTLILRKVSFITRQHSSMPWKSLGEPRYVGRGETGEIYEELVELQHPETGTALRVRRVTVKLNQATRDGDREIHLLTNLPAKVKAEKVAWLYRKRWTLEHAFNELTTHLHCELNTLGYPKAALFAFCVAVCSYNMLAAIKGALRGVHGEVTLETSVSNYFLANEISGLYGGMMVALPPEEWEFFQTLPSTKLAKLLQQWARQANLDNYPKHPRGPKKKPPKKPKAQFQHVATAKLLAKARKRKKKKPKPKTTDP